MSGTEETEAIAPVLARVGARIAAARTHALMTQSMLGDALGVTQTAVSYWEAGKRDMGVADLLRIAEACGTPASSLLPAEHREAPGTVSGDGYFAKIAFMGRIEHVGYVTQVTKHGQAAYHIDLPGKLWGGNPLAWVEHAASAWFSECPLTEEFVRTAWERHLREAAERKRREAGWARMQEQRAIAGGEDGDDEDQDDEDVYDPSPGWPH